MSDKETETNKVVKIVRKIGTVTAAAAALLTQGPAQAKESDILKGLLNRVTITTVSVEDLTKNLPPPLVLTPSASTEGGIMLAGHRSHSSHSSHSSHRSHVSGSGHSSHYSATAAPSSPVPPKRKIPGGGVTEPSDRSQPEQPGAISPVPDGQKRNKNLTPAPYSPPPDVDLENPEERFQLISLARTESSEKAFILDRKTGKRHLYEVKEKIDEYELVRIDMVRQLVQLKGPEKKPIILKKAPPSSQK